MAPAPHTLSIDSSLDYTREELLHTTVQIDISQLFPELVKDFSAALQRWDVVDAEERALRDAIVRAQATISYRDAMLDVFVDRVDLNARSLGYDRNSTQYTALFRDKRPSELKRPVLAAELDTLRGWPKTLEASEHHQLTAMATPVAEAVAAADLAIQGLADAVTNNRTFRLVGNRKKFIDHCNALRAKAYGVIGEYAHQTSDVDGRFSAEFFRARSRSGKSNLETVDAEINALYEQIAELQTVRTKLLAEQEASARAAAETERRAAEVELAKVLSSLEKSQKLAEHLRSKIDPQA